jgi:AmmeMemoRadiSam system protein B
VAIIAPHAGYIYSGPIAASAYAPWKNQAAHINRVVLIGPAHFVDAQGVLASSADGFATPLGIVTVDTQAIGRLLEKGLIVTSDSAHSREHSLEVHLPFLQVLLGDFTVIPLLAGNATATQIAEVLDELWGEPSTRIVISSDLSHYLDWSSARRLDEATARAVEQLEPDAISVHQACGLVPIRGLLMTARRHGLQSRTLDLRNSGDTAGPRDQVVGYGAFAFTQGQAPSARW